MHLAIAGILACPLALATQAPPDTAIDYRHDVAHALQKSESPRDWALGAQLLETQPPSDADRRERAAILQKAAHAAPRDRMVQAMWADFGIDSPCKARTACGDAMALARLEPDNGAAWLPVVARASHGGNPGSLDAAIARMADSSRYNEHVGEAITAWRDVFRRYPPPWRSPSDAVSGEGYVLDLAFTEASATAATPAGSLVDACSKVRHPAASTRRFEHCARIGRIMMNRAQTLVARIYGVVVLRASHAGTAADVERIRTVTWQGEQSMAISSAFEGDVVTKQNFMNLIQANDSEMAALRYELTIFGKDMTPPRDWKQTIDGKPVEPLDDTLGPAPVL